MVKSNQGMKISEIKVAILELPERQKQGLLRWIADMEEQEWDDQIRDDAAGGKLKKLLEEVDADIEAGRLLRGPSRRRSQNQHARSTLSWYYDH